MTNPQVRALLDSLPTDSEFDAFCIDYFPGITRKFSSGMDRTQRINLLLMQHQAADVAAAFSRYKSGQGSVLSQPVFFVPQPLSPHFTGREETLALLRKRLQEKRMVALWGLGGLGKTQTAVAYAHRHRADHSAVLWIGGDAPTSFEQGLFELGRPLVQSGQLRAPPIDERDPSAVRKAVLEYLRQATDYLLICDNVDAPQSLKSIWPRIFGGQVLLTSRSQDSRRLGAVVVELGKLSLRESCEYLSNCHPVQGAEAQEAQSELAQELDGLPLALAQAAAFLIEHQSRYTDYLRQYRRQKLKLLEQELPDDSPKSVSTTWAMSIEQVEQASEASLHLLKLCAFLQPDAIPEELFAKPVPALGETLHAALASSDAMALHNLLKPLGNHAMVQRDTALASADDLALDRLLKPLLNHALVQRDRENRSLSLHRLVQQALLYRMPEEEQAHWAHAAVVQLDKALPPPGFSYWSQYRRLMPQMPVILEHIERFELTEWAATHVLNQAGYFLWQQGQHAEAEQFCRRVLTIREWTLNSDHPDVAVSLNNLGRLLHDSGKLAEAEPSLRRALAIWEQQLGREHSDVAVSLNNLGMLLHDQGKLEEAEPLLRRALAIWQLAYGDSPSVALSMNNLGKLLYDQGRLEEAETLLRDARAMLEKKTSGDHPDLARCLNNLGVVLHKLNKYEEAEPLLCRALAIMEKTLPTGHPLIGQYRTNLDRLMAAKQSSCPPA